MISINLMGGLGNQMFQIAAVISVAYTTNDTFSFEFDKEVYKGQGNNPTYYKDNIFEKIYKNILSLEENCKWLYGYYQSEKYFIKHKDEIIKIFTHDETVDKLSEKYKDVLSDSVSLHIRRGDYIGLQHYHPCPSMEYYQEALSLIKADNILVFSDDIEWCKKNFKNVIFVESQKDYEDLYLMSLCKHHIIANSSFSWWGAYLSRDENVIAPKLWFGDSGPQNWQDIYCKNWIKI